MAFDYRRELSSKTRFVDSRIKDTDLYCMCYDSYVNQKYNNHECTISVPSVAMFKSKSFINAGLGVRHEVLSKNIIQMLGDYCLKYSESRQFNTKHNLVNLTMVSF